VTSSQFTPHCGAEPCPRKPHRNPLPNRAEPPRPQTLRRRLVQLRVGAHQPRSGARI